ncbi:class I SAM-dependent methyltransferase [Microvirga yunnanensis]|uniref:class I SAM-dependent methyltransferase n=1 Tax=Microvirga yunnanensis TaxID=2953740 RepID=UPI0021C795B0|nr:class I SAM-dependent methyltransferase [Microvirga sp. HBU65207]
MASVYSANNPAGYEQLMGRWSRRLAPLFIDFAAVRDGTSILDVGCGTGSLTFALLEAFPTAQIKGLDYSQAFIDYASSKALADGRLVFEQGDAAALPYEDQAFDAALSLLVLNFVPDAQKAARELVRVTRLGGVVAAAVWDFKGGLTHMRVLADTAAALDPSGEAFRARLFSGPFTGLGELSSAWIAMGLRDVVQTSLTIRMEFASFSDYWEPLLAGQGFVGAYVQNLTDEQRRLIEPYLLLAYCAGDADGPRSFTATAWACRGVR